MLWYTIEKTLDERAIWGNVGYLLKALVKHLADKKQLEHAKAVKCFDGDYKHGYIILLVKSFTETDAEGVCTHVWRWESHLYRLLRSKWFKVFFDRSIWKEQVYMAMENITRASRLQ